MSPDVSYRRPFFTDPLTGQPPLPERLANDFDQNNLGKILLPQE